MLHSTIREREKRYSPGKIRNYSIYLVEENWQNEEMLKTMQFRVSSQEGYVRKQALHTIRVKLQSYGAEHAQRYELHGDIKLSFTELFHKSKSPKSVWQLASDMFQRDNCIT